MSETNNSVFSTLAAINVRDKIERKGNLDYLSWANAWAMLKTIYPDAQRKVYESDHTGFNYFTDGRTAWVKVGVTIKGLEHVDYLPIMDHRNNSIPIEKIGSHDVNKSIQRSTAKAIAMHGLGLSLWTGEDIPELTTAVAERPTARKAAGAQPATAGTQSAESGLVELKKGTESWDKVVSYVTANKAQGIEKIGQQLNRKYKMSPAIKKEIANLINS